MNKLHEQLKKHAGTLRLTDAEKGDMRAALESAVGANPLAPARPSWWMHSPVPRFALPALVAFVFAGTAYAAQGALPGDTLYPIKIHVNEAVAGALATTDSAKASFNASVAAERVTEAQRLAAQDRLDATTTQALQSNFDVHAAAAVSYTDKVVTEDPQDGAQLQSQLSAVSAQGVELAAIGSKSNNAQVQKNSRHFSDVIRAAVFATSTGEAARGTHHGDEDRAGAASSVSSTPSTTPTSSIIQNTHDRQGEDE